MKITIIGNSVALRVRPNKKIPFNKNYTAIMRERLDEKNQFVDNIAMGAFTVKEITKNIDYYVNSLPDFYIINLGVVDSCNREVPLWFYRIATSKKDTIFTNLSHHVYRGIIGKMRPFLVWLRFKTSWVSQDKFEKHYNIILRTLIKETNANIISIGINPANDRVENNLPGSRKKQKIYNEIIKSLAIKHEQFFIDTSDLISTEHYPDGVHYNTTGHEIIAERIITIIRKTKR